jgi:hypothetical protein
MCILCEIIESLHQEKTEIIGKISDELLQKVRKNQLELKKLQIRLQAEAEITVLTEKEKWNDKQISAREIESLSKEMAVRTMERYRDEIQPVAEENKRIWDEIHDELQTPRYLRKHRYSIDLDTGEVERKIADASNGKDVITFKAEGVH